MWRLLIVAAVLGILLDVAAFAAGEPKPETPKTVKDTPGKTPPKSDKGKTAGAKKKEEHHCTLRLMWWLLPKDYPELGLQQDDEVVPIGVNQMQVNGVIEYHGDPAVQIMRKAPSPEVDKKGKPITAWIPYTTLPLKADDTDICAILFDTGKGSINTRIFDFKPAVFPFGSLQIINLTRAKVACSLGGKVMTADPNRTAISTNSFVERTAPQFTLAVQESGGEEKLLFNSRLIMSSSVRSLFFVIERMDEEKEVRYEVTTVIDINPAGGATKPPTTAPSTVNKPTPKVPAEKKGLPKTGA